MYINIYIRIFLYTYMYTHTHTFLYHIATHDDVIVNTLSINQCMCVCFEGFLDSVSYNILLTIEEIYQLHPQINNTADIS